jgi:hypothetical protein
LILRYGLKATGGPAHGHKPVRPSRVHGLACLAQRPHGPARWSEATTQPERALALPRLTGSHAGQQCGTTDGGATGACRQQGSPNEHSEPKTHTPGKVAGPVAHRKGAEEWRARFTGDNGAISVQRCFDRPGVAPVARRAEPKVRAAPGPAHEEAQPVVRAGDDRKGKQGRLAVRLTVEQTRPAMGRTNGIEGPPYR